MNKIFKIFLYSSLLLSCLSFLSCGSSERFTSERDSSPHERESETPNDSKSEFSQFNNLKVLESETGEASYYGKKFNGRRTANGEKYNMYALTAAHVSYPFNTIIRVTNLENNKIVIVRINDRYPTSGKRIIDLSYEAAKTIGMIKSGTAEVRLDVLKWGEK